MAVHVHVRVHGPTGKRGPSSTLAKQIATIRSIYMRGGFSLGASATCPGFDNYMGSGDIVKQATANGKSAHLLFEIVLFAYRDVL